MDYQKAKDVRGKSFSSLLIDNIVKGGGVGESLSKTISEKTQSNVKGIKQAFDPLQIAKTLTFGSNLAPALLGRAMGRSKEDIKFFSGKTRKRRSTSISALDNSASGIGQANPAVEALGNIYDLLVEKDELRKQELIDKEKESKDEEDYAEFVNQELIKALTARRKPAKGKKEQYRDEKGRFAKEPPVETPKSAPAPKPATPTPPTPAPKPTAPTPAPKPTTPKVSKTSTPATPIIPPSVSKGIAIGGTAATIVASKIARGESRGESKESYTQANIVGKEVKEAQIVKGNIDVTTGQPFDKSLNEMTIGEVINLAKRRYEYYKIQDPKNPGKFIYRGGSAMGKYQFIPETLADAAKKLYGDNWQNHPFDNNAQEDLNLSFIMTNEERLKKAEIPVTDASLYMMHFFGNEKQTAKVVYGEDNTRMSDILGDFASKQNPSVAKMTVAQYKEHLRKKGFDFQVIDLSQSQKLQNQPSIQNTGIQIDAGFKENEQLKESLNKDKRAQDTVTNNITTNASQKTEEREEPVDDKPAFMKKRRK
jgi:hypothetical protein